jgi:crotonobetainyl-CoA:carnitine CoA-transferase CaiB-like acyl-CoA transferase
MSSALDGLRVIDLSTHLSGPYCSMLLGDLGADVIKIERPEGDDMRQVPPFVNGESAPFMLFNRNKRGVVLDLKTAAGREACLDLAATADVFLENFRPGVAQRLGLEYATLAHRNPRLVYCSISGFGQTGPYRDRGGFDLIAQAMSGLMSITGEETGQPLRIPVPISDLCAGMFAAFAILAALQARERTGLGQHIDHSLFEAAVSLGVYEAAGYLATGEVPTRLGPAHRGSAPYQAFRTRDGWLALGAASQGLWERLCQVLGDESLAADPRFATNARRVQHRRELAELLQARFEREPTEHWLKALEAAGIPAGPVLSYDQVFAHPQTRARDMVVEVDHPRAGRVRLLGIPFKLSATPGRVRRPAPLLGQHTAEVLAELRPPGRADP